MNRVILIEPGSQIQAGSLIEAGVWRHCSNTSRGLLNQIKFVCDTNQNFTECDTIIRQMCRQDTKADTNCTNRCPRNSIRGNTVCYSVAGLYHLQWLPQTECWARDRWLWRERIWEVESLRSGESRKRREKCYAVSVTALLLIMLLNLLMRHGV